MSAPDFATPILGFRAWHAAADGSLSPWSAGAAGPWVPGVNAARCLFHSAVEHVPPVKSCTCGIYALTDETDSRLLPDEQAVGAIAGWGEVEVHRTGFRAQFACVLALGVPLGCGDEHYERLLAASRVYGVELVPLAELRAVGLRYAQPLAFEALPAGGLRGPSPPRSPAPSLSGNEGLRGIACEEHVWLEISRGCVVLGLTQALAAQVQIGSPVELVPSGPLGRGDRVARIGDGDGELRIETPVGAWEVEVNAAVLHDPDLVRVDPEGEGWLVRLTPCAWADEAGAVAWGRAAARVYASGLRREPDPFLGVRARWLRAHAHVTSAADVLAELRAARARRRFASAADVRGRVAARLERAVEAVRERVVRATALITWRLHEPELDVVLDLRAGESPRSFVLHASAETADDYFAGQLDLAAALRAGVVQTSAPVGEVLAVESVIKSLHGAYRAAAP